MSPDAEDQDFPVATGPRGIATERPRGRFCPDCGQALVSDVRGGRRNPYCTGCGFVRYHNPIVGVAVVIRDPEGRVLLGRRARGEYAGLWCIPCGYVEWHEEIREAAVREFREETGLLVTTGAVVAVHSNFHNARQHTVGVWFAGTVTGGSLAPLDGELDALDYFPPGTPPALAFPTDADVLKELAQGGTRAHARSLIRHYPGAPRADVTPIFGDATALGAVARYLATPFAGAEFVAAVDALGFVLGTAMAMVLGCGVLTIRKGGKLPGPVRSRTFTDYSGETKTLSLSRDLDLRGARVVVVDEWIETGAQVAAAIDLLEEAGAQIIGIATISIDQNDRTAALAERFLIRALDADVD